MDTAFVKDMFGRAQAAEKEINEMGFGPDDETISKSATIEDPYWNAPISELTIRVDKRDPRLLRVYVDGELWEKIAIVKLNEGHEHEECYQVVANPHMSKRSFIGPNSRIYSPTCYTWGRALASYFYCSYYGEFAEIGDAEPSLADRMNPELRQVKESE